MPDDDREVTIEDAVGIGREEPFGEDPRRQADGDPVDPQRHRPRRTLREVPCLQPDQHARCAHERLPVDRELRPLLRARNVHADAARRVPVRIAVLRLLPDPHARPDVVEVAGRDRDLHRLRDVAGTVGTERRAVQRLTRLPRQLPVLVGRAQQLLDLDDEVIARAQPCAADRDADDRAALRRQRDARLWPVAPRLDARVDRADEPGPEHDQAEIEGVPLLAGVLAQPERRNGAEEDRDRRAAERTERRPGMVARHPPDEVAGDRERRQESPERRERCKQEPCGALGVLPHGEEPRHAVRRYSAVVTERSGEREDRTAEV